MSEISLSKIETVIYVIRNQKVMLDSDLADLYGVETKQLNRQVRRNSSRFPEDFMFQLTTEEYQVLKCQIGTSKQGSGGKQKLPLVFTESGVAMLSSVLSSDRSVQVNIAIMRTFIKMRSFLAMDRNLEERVSKVEQGTNKLFKIVFERLDSMEDVVDTRLPQRRKKIGLK